MAYDEDLMVRVGPDAEIGRPRAEVAADASEPDNARAWYENITAADGAARMTLRNRGQPSGFAKIAAPVMSAAMRRANRKDLRRLKEILED
jgi:hypothetical protein